MSEIHVCIDQELTDEERRLALARQVAEYLPRHNGIAQDVLPAASLRPDELVLLMGKQWPNGQTLRCRFLNGDPRIQARIVPFAEEWSKYANVHLKWVTSGPAEVRITLGSDGRSYAWIGTDALARPANDETVHFGWLTLNLHDRHYQQVVYHEFGHVLGLAHEQSHPEASIPWDTEAVYRYYAQLGWSRQMVDQNVLARYSRQQTQFSRYDHRSIMQYPVPEELTLGDFAIPWNSDLSETDKAYIGTIYPFPAPPKPEDKWTRYAKQKETILLGCHIINAGKDALIAAGERPIGDQIHNKMVEIKQLVGEK